ncbi:MAG TPA: NUDIX domain-containing protein [Tepidisphaeraceae bacterium]|jgi:8-oxo-dGTP pyrophosphatase MutT (NUDIX family)|nr:NUDIX domain-containing protein [Tepidisphaeraceae bacterium]
MDRRALLIESLNAFHPYDNAEASHRSRMIELAQVPGDPFSRSHFEPGHFTASAFILSPDGNSLLLIHHSKLHRWLQPGGHAEPADADLAATAAREVVEEVGITSLTAEKSGVFDVDIHPIPARKTEPLHEHFDVRYLFRATDLSAVAGSDATAYRWVPIAEVTAELTDASVMRALAKLRK